jgi:hypothetical protein
MPGELTGHEEPPTADSPRPARDDHKGVAGATLLWRHSRSGATTPEILSVFLSVRVSVRDGGASAVGLTGIKARRHGGG